MSTQFKSRAEGRGSSLLGSSYIAGTGGAECHRWKPSVFDFRGAECPTCNGTGIIPKDHEDELVALIPYKDKRLKPQRKCLFLSVSLLVLFVLVALATILMVIFFPRHVDLNVLGMNSTGFWKGGSSIVTLEIEIHLSLVNNNFFPVMVSKFDITLACLSNEVGSIELQPFNLNPRIETPITVYQNATFMNSQVASLVLWLCRKDVYRKLPFHLDIEMTYNYLSQNYDSFVMNSSSVGCSL